MSPQSRSKNSPQPGSERVRKTMSAALAAGLTSGVKAKKVNSRSYEKLFAAATRKTGLGESALIDYALAKIVLEDDFGEQLLALKGSVPRDIDLAF